MAQKQDINFVKAVIIGEANGKTSLCDSLVGLPYSEHDSTIGCYSKHYSLSNGPYSYDFHVWDVSSSVLIDDIHVGVMPMRLRHSNIIIISYDSSILGIHEQIHSALEFSKPLVNPEKSCFIFVGTKLDIKPSSVDNSSEIAELCSKFSAKSIEISTKDQINLIELRTIIIESCATLFSHEIHHSLVVEDSKSCIIL
ncbi:Small GTPase like protein [Aduncisulcus paluster]|uniref:Small GTPase like protein n=1 Tax=Aduncisulcus paluster TaxID=2918883 RepID=A0ABQ5KVM7_9EUKA|nr:Small GTPase like protein [Aduncisulcus paluster]GKT35490.1 Small GTPase like protein [Aduncisulcus paluster]